jgi:Mg/Co/Ni transporter MgtE
VAQILIVVFLNAYNVNDLVNDYSSKAFAAVYLLLPVAIVIANVVGIAANQTTSQFVRIIALNRYDKKEIWQMVGKEFLVTTLSIVALIVFNLVRLLAFYGVQFKGVNESYL